MSYLSNLHMLGKMKRQNNRSCVTNRKVYKFCCAMYCSNNAKAIDARTNKQVKLHGFPNPIQEPERCLNWIINIRRADLNLENINTHKVCSIHFEPRSYSCPSNIAESRLLPTAIPTIIHYPNTAQKLLANSRSRKGLKRSTTQREHRSAVKRTKNSKFEVEQDSRIIATIEPHKCLYDPADEGYHNAELKKLVWQNIAKALDISVNKAKTRWQVLETSYLKSIKSADRFHLFNKMSFLKPYLHPEGEDQCASTEGGSVSIKSEVLSSDEEFADTVEASASDIGTARAHLSEAYKKSRAPPTTCEDQYEKDMHEDLDMKVEEENTVPDDHQISLVANSSFMSEPLSTANKIQDSTQRKRKAGQSFIRLDEEKVDPDLEYFKGFLSMIKELSPKRKRQLFATFAQTLFQHLEEQESEETDSNETY